MSSVYKELGVKIVINATGFGTNVGGSRTYPEVIEAMKEANNSFVWLSELQEAASKIISEVTGAEAGIVTAGSQSALVAASAACMMRNTDLGKMVDAHGFDNIPQESFEWIDLIQLLPKFEEKAKMPDYDFYSQRKPIDQIRLIKNEFILQRVQQSHYTNAFEVPGGRLVWVGAPTDWSNKDEYWHPRQPVSIGELERKITEKTAAVCFIQCYSGRGGLQLGEIVEIAHKHGVPVIVDASCTLALRSNLRKPIDAGADLVSFSGGKAIRGPNDTGILAGRSDLIKLAHAQSAPYHGVCRGYKVSKEQIVGLIKALKIWLKHDEKEEIMAWDAKVKYVIEELSPLPNIIEVKRICIDEMHMAQISIDEKNLGMTTRNVWEKLRKGDPHILLVPGHANNLIFDPFCLEDGEEKLVVNAIKRILK